jgi:hypothetical protein
MSQARYFAVDDASVCWAGANPLILRSFEVRVAIASADGQALGT